MFHSPYTNHGNAILILGSVNGRSCFYHKFLCNGLAIYGLLRFIIQKATSSIAFYVMKYDIHLGDSRSVS